MDIEAGLGHVQAHEARVGPGRPPSRQRTAAGPALRCGVRPGDCAGSGHNGGGAVPAPGRVRRPQGQPAYPAATHATETYKGRPLVARGVSPWDRGSNIVQTRRGENRLQGLTPLANNGRPSGALSFGLLAERHRDVEVAPV